MSEKYIIYVHPTSDNPAKDQLDTLWTRMNDSYKSGAISLNEAMRYPPHITITSFTCNLEIMKSVQDTFRNINLIMESFTLRERVDLVSISIKSRILDDIASRINTVYNLKTPSSERLHISIAHKFKPEDLPLINQMVTECIDLSKWTLDNFRVILWGKSDKWRVIE